MIDKASIIDMACRAGFGGVSRNRLYSKLNLFAEQVSNWTATRDAQLCNEIAAKFKEANTEFRDGQMDGAYQCEEIITSKITTR
jgi:hypothetical protein